MKLSETVGPGVRRFIGNTLYETFEHVIMLILTIIIVVLIAYATYHLVLTTFDSHLWRANSTPPTRKSIPASSACSSRS